MLRLAAAARLAGAGRWPAQRQSYERQPWTAAKAAAEMVPASFSLPFTYWYTPYSPAASCQRLKIVGPPAPTYWIFLPA